MKKVKIFICMAVMLFAFQMSAGASDEIKVILNGTKLSFEQNPVTVDNRTLVPLRGIFEAMGADVSWDNDTQSVSAVKGKTVVKMTIGDKNIYVNSNKITLDVPAQLVYEKTMVPARAVAESFGADVSWDGDTKSVIIKTDEFLERAREVMDQKDECVFTGKVSMTASVLPFDLNVKAGISVKDKLTFVSLSSAVYNYEIAGGEEAVYTNENGSIKKEAGNNFDDGSLLDISALVFDKSDDKYTIYKAEGETDDGMRIYFDKNSAEIAKIVIPADVINKMMDNAVSAKSDAELSVAYNTGETKAVWDKYNK